MNFTLMRPVVLCSWAFALAATGVVWAQEPSADDGKLVEFASKEGDFAVKLPGKPAYEKTMVGDAEEVQHQFTVGQPQGVYLISYQENPNLEEGTPEQMTAALESGRDRLLEAFRGKLVESKETTLDKKHPGLEFSLTIPAAKGEARCRFYMVGTRLYQVMALGTPEFVKSRKSTEVLDSFKLLSEEE